MKNEHLPNNKMLCFLTRISAGSNPFLFQNSKASNNYIYPKADSIIYKEELDVLFVLANPYILFVQIVVAIYFAFIVLING